MAVDSNNLPPIPPDQIGENRNWRDWLTKVSNIISGGYTGSITISGTTLTIRNGIITNVS